MKNEKITINEIRDKWEIEDFPVIQNSAIKQHTKFTTRFRRGQLVTVQFDFEQKVKINENETATYIIQAGQTGIISDYINSNILEVTFWAIPFVLLALERKDFVSSPPKDNPFSYAINSWKRKIFIHKDFLFPLYCKDLQ